MPISIGGQTYTDEQVRDFYANGGNDNEYAQKAGITDPWQRRELILAARQAGGGAGTAANSGDAGMQRYFQQYQQYNPNGADVNSYDNWLKNQNPNALAAMQSGTYTGAASSGKDWDFGGIYGPGTGHDFGYEQGRYGTGAHGTGDGWNAWTGAAGENRPGGTGGAGGSGANLGMGGSGGGGYGGSGASGGSSSSSMQSSTQGGGQNPYLYGMGQNIINQMTENYTRNQLPASRSGAMAAGGFGGSRQGVVEANGLNDLNRGIGQNLTNLYGQDWTNSQNRNLQQQSINNSYDLGIRGNDLGYANLDSNNQQFGANYGLNLMNAQNNWAQQGVQNANGIQNAPIDYSRYFNGQSNQIGGQGGTQTNTQTNPGNPWIGAVGGAQLANSWFNGRG